MRLGQKHRHSEFPTNAFSSPISHEPDQAVFLIAIEALDRVMQSSLGQQLGMNRQGVINSRRPAFSLECRENCFLHRRRKLKYFHEFASQSQLAPIAVPLRPSVCVDTSAAIFDKSRYRKFGRTFNKSHVDLGDLPVYGKAIKNLVAESDTR